MLIAGKLSLLAFAVLFSASSAFAKVGYSQLSNLVSQSDLIVEAWAELHREELNNDWELLQTGRRPQPIAPLQ